MRHVMLLLSVLLATFVGCGSEFVGMNANVLPADQVNDVLRDGEFDYAIVAPVKVSITVSSYNSARALGEPVPIVVSFTDSSGDSCSSPRLRTERR